MDKILFGLSGARGNTHAAVSHERDRVERTTLADNARLSSAYQARAADTAASTQDAGGYWNGGTPVTFFRFGVSKFGDGSVLA